MRYSVGDTLRIDGLGTVKVVETDPFKEKINVKREATGTEKWLSQRFVETRQQVAE